MEEEIFIPAVRNAERKLKQNDVSAKISSMINQTPMSDEQLSDREKDVIVALVQGMTNKEIADHLFISINTVITHAETSPESFRFTLLQVLQFMPS